MPQQILDLFPLQESVAEDTASINETDLSTNRLKRMGESLIWQKPVPLGDGEDSEIQRAGNSYKYYRSVDSLPEPAREFYNRAGKCIYV